MGWKFFLPQEKNWIQARWGGPRPKAKGCGEEFGLLPKMGSVTWTQVRVSESDAANPKKKDSGIRLFFLHFIQIKRSIVKEKEKQREPIKMPEWNPTEKYAVD